MNWLYLCMRWLVFSHLILNSQEIFFSKTDFGRLVGFEKKCVFCMFFFFLSLSFFDAQFRYKDKYVCISCKWRPGLFIFVSKRVCMCVCVWFCIPITIFSSSPSSHTDKHTCRIVGSKRKQQKNLAANTK